MEFGTRLCWGAALALSNPNKGNRVAGRASARWTQRRALSQLRALQVSRGEAGDTDREEYMGALWGSLSCLGRSRRPWMGVPVAASGEVSALASHGSEPAYPQQTHVCGAP